ncbi:hypothetical protein GCM10027287_43830 [Bordetella muralis]
MRELSSSDLQLVSGGFDTVGASVRAFGTVNSVIGYLAAIRTLQRWGGPGHETKMGAASAMLISRFATHSLWDGPGPNAQDRTSAGMAGCFLLGAGVGLAQGIIQTVAADLIKA